MLGAADPPPLVAYAEKIETLAQAFTPICWAPLYQTEARFRRDKLVHVQRTELKAYQDALADNRAHPYDPLRPWDRCYEMATESFYSMCYWQENFDRPAMMILSGSRSTGDFLDGDAAIASSSSGHISTSYATPSDVGLAAEVGRPQREPPGGKRPTAPAPAGAPVPKKQRAVPKPEPQHNVQNGSFTTNRMGKQLCKNYQTDSCTHGRTCKYAHQCAKCLGNHGSQAPSPCTATPKDKSKSFARKGGKKGE